MSAHRWVGTTTVRRIEDASVERSVAVPATPIQRARRALTLIDQALASGTNFGAAALSAGLLSSVEFGAFAVASSVLIFAVGVGRASSGSILMIESPRGSDVDARSMLGGASATAIAIGVLMAMGCVAVGTLLRGPAGTALLFLAPTIPIVLAQDTYRHHALARERAGLACINDAAWLVGLVVGMATLRLLDVRSLALAIVVAYGSALLGLLAAASIERARPTVAAMRTWVGNHLSAAIRLVGDFLLALSYGVVPLILVTAVNANLEQAGGLRVAQALMGPLTVVFAASTLQLQPTMVRARSEPSVIFSLARRQSTINIVVATTWLVCAIGIPDGVGIRLFGESWTGADRSILLLGVAFIGLAISTGPLTALRSVGMLTQNFIAQCITAVVVLSSAVVCALALDGGLLVGFAIGNLLGAAAPWVMLRNAAAHRESPARVIGL